MPHDEIDPGAWQTLRSERGDDLKIFRVRYDYVRNPRNQIDVQAVVLETPDWVEILAITPQGRIVFVDQYRFGAAALTTEIPAGSVDPHESPLCAAERELREETGYRSSQWRYLGWVQPNPAFHDNRCHQFLALNAEPLHTVEPGRGEAIRVRTLTVEQVQGEIEAGKIRNALALLALSRLFNIWGTFQGFY